MSVQGIHHINFLVRDLDRGIATSLPNSCSPAIFV